MLNRNFNNDEFVIIIGGGPGPRWLAAEEGEDDGCSSAHPDATTDESMALRFSDMSDAQKCINNAVKRFPAHEFCIGHLDNKDATERCDEAR